MAEGISKLCEDLGVDPTDIALVGGKHLTVLLTGISFHSHACCTTGGCITCTSQQSTGSILASTSQPVSLLTTQSPAALGAAQHTALLPRLLQLVLSYHLSARIMCEYTRDEWVNGLTR